MIIYFLAPWRVQQDGKSFADAMEIGGSSTIRGFLYNKEIKLNKDNYSYFIKSFILLEQQVFDMRSFGGNIFFEDDIALQNVTIYLQYETLAY